MALLRILDGENSGKLIPLENEILAIGRDSTELPILDQGVSRQHAEIFRIGELFFIRDLESRNGTFVNESKVVDQEVLRNGDQLQVGNTTLCFEDSYARVGDSRILEFQDSVEMPDATITFSLPGAQAQASEPASDEHKRLKVLYRVSRLLSAGNKVSEILHNVAKELCLSLGADDVYLFEFKADNDNQPQFHDIASYHSDPSHESLPISRSILGRVMKDGQPVLTSDAALDDRFNAAQSIVMKKIKSVLAVPLMFMNKPIGAFYAVNNRQAEKFGAEDLELATTVGMLVGNTLETWEALDKQSKVYRNVLKTIAAVSELHSPNERGESERVANFAAAMARTAGYGSDEVRHVWIAGLLHNIGAMSLGEEDFKAVNVQQRIAKHTVELLDKLPELEDVAPIIKQHTERFDGSGFPEGLSKDKISREAYMVGLATEFERVLGNGGDSGKQLSLKQAVIQIRDLAGKKFPIEVVNSLLISYRKGDIFDETKNLFELGH